MIKIKKKYKVWQFQFDLVFFILKMFGISSKAAALKYFIFIHSQYEDDYPLICHEKFHLREQKEEGFWLYLKRYKRDQSYRYRSELRAHAIEFLAGGDLNRIAKSFHNNYDLEIKSRASAESKILNEVNLLVTTGQDQEFI